MFQELLTSLNSFFLPIWPILPPFIAGFLLAVILDWRKGITRRARLLEHLRLGCISFKKTYKRSNDDTTPIILFPEIKQLIISGQMHHFNDKITKSIYRLSELQRVINEIMNGLIRQEFDINGSSFKIVKDNFTKYSNDAVKTNQDLLDMLPKPKFLKLHYIIPELF